METLGSGSYSIVKRVRHIPTGQLQAMKIIYKKRMAENVEWREMEILRHLDHPNILVPINYFSNPLNFYIITELCNGGTLLDYIRNKGSISEGLAIDIVRQILHGLAYVHAQGIIHRDIKLDNLFVQTAGDNFVVKIGDFGGSVYKAHSGLGFFGTAAYVAPEVVKGAYDEKADLWSTGISHPLHRCLRGKDPSSSNNTVVG